MTWWTRKTVVTFERAFTLDGFDEPLPAGRYHLESRQESLDGMFLPDCLRGSVLIHLHALPGRPGLARTLTVPWEDLDRALARDRSPATRALATELDALMADPMTRLVMLSDGVSEAEIRTVLDAVAARVPSTNRGKP